MLNSPYEEIAYEILDKITNTPEYHKKARIIEDNLAYYYDKAYQKGKKDAVAKMQYIIDKGE